MPGKEAGKCQPKADSSAYLDALSCCIMLQVDQLVRVVTQHVSKAAGVQL